MNCRCFSCASRKVNELRRPSGKSIERSVDFCLLKLARATERVQYGYPIHF